MRRLPAVTLALLLAAVSAACAAPGAADPASDTGAVTVRDAWARAATAGGTSAAYLEIVNGRSSADVLVGVSTDAAASASIHETTTTDGMTGMHHVPGLEISAGGTATLEPGSYHVMLEDLVADLAPGSTIRLVLTFERSGPVDVVAEVRGS